MDREQIVKEEPMEIRQPAGHLDQMVRQTRAHHVQLSAMADAKANMMLTISAIVGPLSIRYLQDPEFFAAAGWSVVQ